VSLTPTQKLNVRRAIADYCVRAEQNRLRWHYTQQRPFGGFGMPPDVYHANDCSGYVSLAFDHARRLVGVPLSDPLGEHYSGWGYTGTELEFLKAHPVPLTHKLMVGDCAIFGTVQNTVHTSICRTAGNVQTAVFSSNGHESWVFAQDAPEPISLAVEKAQQSLVGVFRHPALL
jgi:hypothetical protein